MANSKLKSDSPVCQRIVLAFLEFLDSVEPAEGVDVEGLEVVKECLVEAFNLDPSSLNNQKIPNILLDIFHKLEVREQTESRSNVNQGSTSLHAPSSSSSKNASGANISEDDDGKSEFSATGMSKDELFGQFFSSLEKIDFLKTTPDGHDDPLQLDKATRLFHDSLTEMERSGCQIFNRNNLAEAFKLQGNKAMQSKLYSDAIDCYTCAIALCADNAVYYCNRAAAFTQINKYAEAIRDCLRSTEIEPSYSKAYSRLGLAYYAQGNYKDAIDKGFKRALELDPNNEAVKENIRVAEQKLKEEKQWADDQGSESGSNQAGREPDGQSGGGSWSHAAPPLFTSMPFDGAALPADFANMIMNLAANARHGSQPQNTAEESNINNLSDEPEIRVGGNISVSIGEQMPVDLTGALRSVMSMFSERGGGGGASHGTSQESSGSGPTPN